MPYIGDHGLGLNPSAAPQCYPGAVVNQDCLLVGRWLYPVRTRGGKVSPWPGEQLEIDGGPLATLISGRLCTMREALEVLRVAGPESRQPVLAIGSNAAPGQLLHKYGSASAGAVIPVSIASVAGLRVAHSAHVSKPGYIPYAPFRSHDQVAREYHIQWLTPEQIEVLDATEPNYLPVTLRTPEYGAVLKSGIAVPGYRLYLSKWGVIRFPESGAAVAGTQDAIYMRLFGFSWFQELVPEWRAGVAAAMQALRQDEARRAQLRDALTAHGVVGEANLP